MNTPAHAVFNLLVLGRRGEPWDPAHYGHIVTPIEALMVLVGSLLLWGRFSSPWILGGIVTLGLFYLLYGIYVTQAWLS